MKSPAFCAQTYGIFDVPHETQDLITEEERAPVKVRTIAEIFASCKVYVEVRTDDDDRSEGVKMQLLKYGITVNEKFYKDTTHVIFKDGLMSTYKNAIERKCPVTTVLWFEACLAQKRLVDPAQFKISNLDRYEHPELYKRMRRPKPMQPDTSKFKPYNAIPKSYDKGYFDERTRQPILETTVCDLTMELTLQNEETLVQSPESINIDTVKKIERDYRRFTTFTPKPMEQTGRLANDRRTSLFVPGLTQKSDAILTSEGSKFSKNTIVFNSHNKVSKYSRRTVFDISMNLLEMNCRAMSQKKDVEEAECPERCDPKTDTPSALATQSNFVTTIRKRKLFCNETYMDELEDSKENLNKSVKETEKKSKLNKLNESTKKKPQMNKITADRRKTLEYFKTEKRKDAAKLKKTPMKLVVQQKFIVVTNMSTQDKCILNAVSGISFFSIMHSF